MKKPDTRLNASQRRFLAAGSELFMRHGIRRVTVEEICRKAGLSKVTFYKYFPNKNRLALDILQGMIAEAEGRYQRIRSKNIPYADTAREIIQLKLEYSRDMSKEMLADLYGNPDPEIKGFIRRKAAENLQTTMRDFSEAQEKGEVRADIKPEFIIYFLNHMLEMLEDDNLVTMYDSVQDLTRELINFFFYGILPNLQSQGSPCGPGGPDRGEWT